MSSKKAQWELNDFSQAMANAIFQNAHHRYLKQNGDMLKFNGFWRNGDKQNICAWLNKATWHDAKTGEGGGCKEFAKVAFNQTLPEFMERFGRTISIKTFKKTTPAKAFVIKPIDEIWSQLFEKSNNRSSQAEQWLEKNRGFDSPRKFIGSGFASLEKDDVALFHPQHHNFIKHRLSLGPQIIAPIRNVFSNKPQNLFFRTISDVNKSDKSRLLPHSGGWSEQDGSLRAFGFPQLIQDFSKLILCEGMADYFAIECLLGCDENFLAIGASNAAALNNWATWFSTVKYKGNVIILYQLDADQFGKISTHGVGQLNATKALKILLQNKVSASLFKWANFLRRIKTHEHRPSDIADVCKIYGTKSISDQFITTLNEAN